MDNQEHSKTEEATPFKLSDARNKGMVARGLDVGVLFGLLTVVGYFWVYGGRLATALARAGGRAIVEAPQLAISNQAVSVWLRVWLRDVASALVPLMGAVVFAGILASTIQVGFLFAPEALKPDFSKLNPANGLKRVFAVATLLETAKAAAKFAVYAVIAYLIISKTVATALGLEAGPRALLHLIWSQAMHLLVWFAVAAAIFAAIDQFLVRRQFQIKMRMSRSDIKDELKHREGDSRIKQRRKQLQRELLKRAKSMRSLRSADLLITNPTHYAVGLRYDARVMTAPTIIARGAGDFAQRLKRIAFIYRVPVFEAPELARGLFFQGRLDQQIPAEWVRETAKIYVRSREQAFAKAA